MRSQTGAFKMDKSSPFTPRFLRAAKVNRFSVDHSFFSLWVLTYLPCQAAQLASSLHKKIRRPRCHNCLDKETWRMGWRTANCVA